jgi:hypothetical protein
MCNNLFASPTLKSFTVVATWYRGSKTKWSMDGPSFKAASIDAASSRSRWHPVTSEPSQSRSAYSQVRVRREPTIARCRMFLLQRQYALLPLALNSPIRTPLRRRARVCGGSSSRLRGRLSCRAAAIEHHITTMSTPNASVTVPSLRTNNSQLRRCADGARMHTAGQKHECGRGLMAEL